MPSVLLLLLSLGALAWRRRASNRARREAVLDECLWIASRAQRWWLTPLVLGGADRVPGFAGLSFEALGLHADATGRRWTDAGVYRVLPVPQCRALSAIAAAAGEHHPEGGVLILGCERGRPSAEAVAVLALSGLITVPLPSVPWRWVAALVRPVVRATTASTHPRRAQPRLARRRLSPHRRARLRRDARAAPLSGRVPARPPPALRSPQMGRRLSGLVPLASDLRDGPARPRPDAAHGLHDR